MPSKWELVLDQKPVPLGEHLLVECSRLFASDLTAWPPPLTGAAAPEGPRPGPALLREAFRLARWDLQREHEAYDEYMRNARWSGAGLSASDKPMLLFMSRFIEEQLLSLNEATQGRVDRSALLQVLDLTERAVLKVSPA